MSSLLITGGAGFIGTNFVLHWAKANPEDSITVLDALTYAGNKSNLTSFLDKPNFKFVEGSICDQGLVERVFFENEIDRVVHFAADSHVDR